MTALVTMDRDGRLTVPAEPREQPGLSDETQLERLWSASASVSLRVTFQCLPDARKMIPSRSRRYDR
jgi:hypothetical protein